MTRTPGKTLVYLGCLFLIVGVFAMLYVRERRLWVWLEDAPDSGGTRLTTALSSTALNFAPNTGGCATTAVSWPGRCMSMPTTAGA